MKKISILVATLLIGAMTLVSCEDEVKQDNVKAVVVETIETVKTVKTVEKEVDAPLIYVGGSNYGDFLVSACVGNYENIIVNYTSSASIETYSKEGVLEFYKTLKFAKNEKWTHNNTSQQNTDGTYTQDYTRSIQGVYAKVVTLTFIQENGDWKLVLPEDLNTFLK